MRSSRRRLSFQGLETRRLLAAVDIPDDLTGAAAQTVSAPVNVDSASGIRAAEIRLTYNTNVLDLDQASITAGSVFDGLSDVQVTANVDDVTGTVVVFVSTSTSLGDVAGSLVRLNFTVASGATVGTTAVLDLTQATLNEGQIATTPAPVSGSDSTDGLITIVAGGGIDRIAGFVFADTNTNSAFDVNEGIPGVRVTLVNQSTQAEQQVTSGADGSYEFAGLAAGTYLIREAQPTAYLEGGENEITATLVTGTALTNQNFRELGLLPQFVYNRLLTTLVMPVGSTAWTNEIAKINTDAANSTVSPAPAVASSSSASALPFGAAVQSVAAATSHTLAQAQLAPAASSPVASVIVAGSASLTDSYWLDAPDDTERHNVVDEALAITSLW